MNDVVIVLLIQLSLLTVLPLLWKLLGFFQIEKGIKTKILTSIFSSVLILLSTTVFALYISKHLNVGGITEVSDSFNLVTIYDYSFDLGIKLTAVNSIILYLVQFSVSVISIYLTWKRENWSIEHISRLLFYLVFITLLIVSPNFFQILICLVIADILFIEFSVFQSKSSNSEDKKSLKNMIVSQSFGDILILISFILLIRRSMTMDFSKTITYLKLSFSATTPYFAIACGLLLLGIIAKSALFPFHSWFINFSKGDMKVSIFPTILSISVSMYLFFLTPFNLLIPLVSRYFLWYGIILSVIVTLFVLFLRNKLEIAILFMTLFNALILFSLGISDNSSAFQLLIVSPPIIFSLAILSLIDQTHDETIESNEKRLLKTSKDLMRYISLTLLIVTIIGVIPFNSTFVTFIHVFSIGSVTNNYLIFILLLLVLIGIFSVSFQFYRKYSSKSKSMMTTTELLLFFFFTVLLSLNTVLYPPFEILNPFELHPSVDFSTINYPLIILVVVYGLILLGHFVIEISLVKFKDKISTFAGTIQEFMTRIFYYDILITPFILFNVKIIHPSVVWINKKILHDFLYKIILVNFWKVIVVLWKYLRDLTKNLIVPTIKKTLVNTSKFLHQLEKAKLQTQIQFVVFGVAILLIIVIILFSGGII